MPSRRRPPTSHLRFLHQDERQQIRVVDVFPEGHRLLYFEDSVQGAITLEDHRVPALEYLGLMMSGARALISGPSEVIVGGLGSASLYHTARHWWCPPARIVVVESNPKVVEIARRFFRLPEDCELIADDLRHALGSGSGGVSDLVLVDCYDAQAIPPHLLTLEFMELVRWRLGSDGAAVFNVWSEGCNELAGCQLRTILAGFGSAAVVRSRRDGNLVVLVQKARVPSWPPAVAFKREYFPLTPLREGDSTPMLEGAEVLRDDNLSRVFRRFALGQHLGAHRPGPG